MRCLSCNVELDDEESTRKDPITEEYIDMCNYCYDGVRYLNDSFIIGD